MFGGIKTQFVFREPKFAQCQIVPPSVWSIGNESTSAETRTLTTDPNLKIRLHKIKIRNRGIPWNPERTNWSLLRKQKWSLIEQWQLWSRRWELNVSHSHRATALLLNESSSSVLTLIQTCSQGNEVDVGSLTFHITFGLSLSSKSAEALQKTQGPRGLCYQSRRASLSW